MAKPYLISISVNELDLQSWRPHSIEDVYLNLNVEIGWEGKPGSQLFYTLAASPEAIRARAHLVEGKIFSTRALVVVTEFDYTTLQTAINDIVKSAERESIEESANVLGRYFQWEYEDFNRAPAAK